MEDCVHYYEYLVMPYGLVNVPLFFQAFINEILHYTLNSCKHISLKKLLDNNLCVKFKKSEFLQTSVKFLHLILDEERMQIDHS